MAMKHLGLFRDQVEVEHRVTWEDIIAASREGERWGDLDASAGGRQALRPPLFPVATNPSPIA